MIRGDKLLIERMIRNLVDNAVIHNDDNGSISVELRREPDGTEATIKISNTGPRLAPPVAAQLGRPFYRATSGYRGVPGTGLGLPIAISIAEAHGGGLAIEARKGGGVAVAVSIPVVQ